MFQDYESCEFFFFLKDKEKKNNLKIPKENRKVHVLEIESSKYWLCVAQSIAPEKSNGNRFWWRQFLIRITLGTFINFWIE